VTPTTYTHLGPFWEKGVGIEEKAGTARVVELIAVFTLTKYMLGVGVKVQGSGFKVYLAELHTAMGVLSS